MKNRCTSRRWPLGHKWSAWSNPRADKHYVIFGGERWFVMQSRRCWACGLVEGRDLPSWPVVKRGDGYVAAPVQGDARVPDALPKEDLR